MRTEEPLSTLAYIPLLWIIDLENCEFVSLKPGLNSLHTLNSAQPNSIWIVADDNTFRDRYVQISQCVIRCLMHAAAGGLAIRPRQTTQ